MTRLDVSAFGFMLGCIWSVGVLVLGIVSMLSNWGSGAVKLFSTVYIGYRATLQGSLVGAAWGFIDGAISGIVIAWAYNRFI